MLLLLYVDDISLAYPRTVAAAVAAIKAKLAAKYKIANLGTAKQFLGIQITNNDDGIALSRNAFISAILTRFGMEEANGAATPINTSVRPDLPEELGKREVDPKECQAMVESLMYIALATRPDIAFAVSALSRYNSQPRTVHLTAAKRVLRYLRKTADHSLHFNGNGNDGEITGYTDSDWANDSTDRKSQGGHVFLCNGSAISWKSRKQDLVALSTTRSRIYSLLRSFSRSQMAMPAATRHDRPEGQRQANAYILRFTRRPARITTASGIMKARTKHIDVCYHNSRNLHARRIVKYGYANTDDNPADLLTKGLPRGKHEKFTRAMGIW